MQVSSRRFPAASLVNSRGIEQGGGRAGPGPKGLYAQWATSRCKGRRTCAPIADLTPAKGWTLSRCPQLPFTQGHGPRCCDQIDWISKSGHFYGELEWNLIFRSRDLPKLKTGAHDGRSARVGRCWDMQCAIPLSFSRRNHLP